MATLGDELMNDFADSGSEGDGLDGAASQANEENEASPGDEHASVDKADEGVVPSQNKLSDTRSASALLKKLQPLLDEIDRLSKLPPSEALGNTEDNPEYKLLGEANKLSGSIDDEVQLLYKFIRDHYSVRFPELETLIQNPQDYCKAVAIIGNGPMERIQELSTTADNMVGQSLHQFLPGPTLMVVRLEASTTRGRPLLEATLESVLQACRMVLTFDKAKKTLTEFVQSRMNIFAPNLTVLIGSLTAAQLINYTGGLNGLAKTPACNIAPLGSKRQTGTGFATNMGVRHQGFIYESPIMDDIPTDLHKQALRIISAKIVLAARVDAVQESPDGSIGHQFKEACLQRLEKLTEPPPNKGVRALPAPDDKPSRKRGGRRARKAKEANAMTDLAKAQNRMAFGKEEQEVGFGDGTKGLGMIGQGNDGRIRAQQIDQRTKAKLSKKNPGWGAPPSTNGLQTSLGRATPSGTKTELRGHGLRTEGVNTSSLGTQSSVAFTPVQGLELVDPKIRAEESRKRKAESDRWFRSGTFTQAGTATAKLDAGGFKVPQLPPNKKLNTGGG